MGWIDKYHEWHKIEVVRMINGKPHVRRNVGGKMVWIPR